MAVTLATDLKVYDAAFQAGYYEKLATNSAIFNERSNNAIVLSPNEHVGDYLKQAYFKTISNLVTRQDITSTAAATALKMTQGEDVGVKVHRKIGPVDNTFKAFKMAGIETEEGSYKLGQMVAEAVLNEMARTALIAANAAVSNVAGLINDISASGTATFAELLKTRLKWGDQAAKLAAWIMHSKPFGDLMQDGLTTYNLESVAGAILAAGGIDRFMGAAALISDFAALKNTGTPDTYNVLGLAQDAVLVQESEEQDIVIQPVTGQEQLILRMQGELAITVKVAGFAYNTAAGANPDDTTLGTAANWVKQYSDDKALPLVKLLCQ